MPGPITRVAQVPTGTIYGPENGDNCDKPSVTAADTGFQRLANETKWLYDTFNPTLLRLILDGVRIGPAYVTCDGNGTNNLSIGPIDSLVLYNRVLASSAFSFDPGVLTPSTFYRLYLYNNSGTIAAEVSATVPDGNVRFKDGDSTRYYVATMVTDTAGYFRAFYKSGRDCRYIRSAGDDPRVLNPGASGSYAAVSLAGYVPPHVRDACVSLNLLVAPGLAAGALADAYLRTPGQTGDVSYQTWAISCHQHVAGANNRLAWIPVRVITNASQQIEYRLTQASSSSLYMVVDGYTDWI